MTFSPAEDSPGNYYMHILIGKGENAVEIRDSPYMCTIKKSNLQKQLEEQ